jgi:hypothetical protein
MGQIVPDGSFTRITSIHHRDGSPCSLSHLPAHLDEAPRRRSTAKQQDYGACVSNARTCQHTPTSDLSNGKRSSKQQHTDAGKSLNYTGLNIGKSPRDRGISLRTVGG